METRSSGHRPPARNPRGSPPGTPPATGAGAGVPGTDQETHPFLAPETKSASASQQHLINSDYIGSSNNISASRIPLMLRLRGTVILKTWWQIGLVELYTIIIVYLHLYVEGVRINFPQTLIGILGAVTGLLLAFRTNTAYDRYWEGRRLWSTVILNIRTLTRLIWIGVKDHSVKTIVEKKSALNLLVAFAVATKHYLREEYSYDFDDLKQLLTPITTVHGPTTSSGGDNGEAKENRARKRRRDHFTARDIFPPTNIPIEITYYIGSFIASCRDGEKCDGGTIGSMNAALTNLVDCLTSFERILRTPIPVAYSVHLHHMTWLYILALPFQLVGLLGWWTVLIVGVATFSFLGILEIGWEIENPFGYDSNDLPLDDFCYSIKQEIERVTLRDPLKAADWIFTEENHPFSSVKLSALQLSGIKPAEMKELIKRNKMLVE